MEKKRKTANETETNQALTEKKKKLLNIQTKYESHAVGSNKHQPRNYCSRSFQRRVQNLKKRRYTVIYNHMTKMQGNQMETRTHTCYG